MDELGLNVAARTAMRERPPVRRMQLLASSGLVCLLLTGAATARGHGPHESHGLKHGPQHGLDSPSAPEDPAAWVDSLTFRTYGRADFGLMPRAGSRLGAALATGDFNGDGVPDLVAGAPNDNPSGTDSGWFGVVTGGVPFPGAIFSSPGDQAAGQWGALFAEGDFNADGYADLAVGVPRRDFGSEQDSGTVWLLDGSPTGVGRLSRPVRDVGEAGALDGASLAVGDFNGDGIDDLAVGTPRLKLNGISAAGQATLLIGRASAGPVSGGSLVIDRSLEEVEGDPAGDEALATALAAGDFDGDGNDDIAIGIPGAGGGSGAALVAYLGEDAETRELTAFQMNVIDRDDETVPGVAERGAQLGAALVAGNFDGDGFADLAIAAPGTTLSSRRGAGEILLARGTAGGLDFGVWTPLSLESDMFPQVGSAAGDRFGEVMLSADADGDGTDDLLVGAPGKGIGIAASAGVMAVAFGGPDGLTSGVAVPAGAPGLGMPAHNRQAFGAALAVADLNQDGANDIVIGASGQTIDGVTDAGAVLIGWGESDTLPGVPTATPQPATPTRTPTRTPTAGPTATPRPVYSFYVPYVARLGLLNRYPTLPPPP